MATKRAGRTRRKGHGIHGESRIYANGCLKTAKELFAKYAKSDTLKRNEEDGSEDYDVKGELLVNSINERSGKIVETSVSGIRRQSVVEKIVQVTLANGLRITITASQKLFTRNGWLNGAQLEVGAYIAIPSRMVKCRRELKVDGKPVTRELVELLSWQISEGNEQKTSSNRATITQKDRSVLEHLHRLTCAVEKQHRCDMSLNYIYEPKDDTRLPYLSLTSAEYKQMLLRNGYAWGELSAGKIFPDFIMTASDEFTKLFIRAYMDAEACFTHSKGVIEMSTASPTVAMQMFTLLKRFGIGSRIMCKRKCATNGRRIYRDYYEIHISGQALRIYRAKIGFGVDYKSDGLNDVCDNRKCNSNLEKIPMYTELCKLREATQISKSLITSKPNFYGKTNPSVMESHKIMERVDKLLVMPENQVAWRLDNRINYMTAERKKHLRTFKTFLARELSKEVCYIEIKSIECTQYSGWVYDLQVKGSTNYVAEGILCQNY